MNVEETRIPYCSLLINLRNCCLMNIKGTYTLLRNDLARNIKFGNDQGTDLPPKSCFICKTVVF